MIQGVKDYKHLLYRQMDKTISSSCYDAIVIKQQNRTYRSTPFQVVFSSNLIKQIQKNRLKHKAQPYKLSFYVNDRLVDISLKIDQSGRIVFEKVYNRKMSAMVSDSSDVSDEDLSHKSSNKTLDTKTKNLQKLEQYKNQQAPVKFWQFAWLFSQKKQDTMPPPPHVYKIDEQQSNLTKIKQQIYQGQQHSKQPLFHLSLCGNLLKKKQTKQQILKTFYDHRVEYNQFIKDPPGYINDSNLVVKIDDSIYTWQLGITILTCRFAYGRQLTKDQIQDIIKNKFTKSRLFSFISGGSNITKLDITEFQDEDQIRKKNKQLKKIKQIQKPVIKFRKTPDSDTVKKMKLKYGKNIGKFELDVGQGNKQTITMKIFLWDHSQKIIISDIDGTITKSDILGQILNKWIHSGVTKLFTEIYKRHYKIIYLTARAIGQYQQTSKFLQTVEQENVFLPEGPLLMSPDGYMRSFTRQIIYKTPDFLKTKILASLNEVFPNTKNPIYCGFGNRQTDSAAYLKINIAPDKIFCITQKSIISRESDKQFNSTYKDILNNINEFFPEYFKDNTMVDSSEEDQIIQQYHAVQANEIGKKTKSVDGGDRFGNLQGYQSDQLSNIGNLSKSRKSQHEIPDEDLKSLQYMTKSKMSEPQNVQNSKVLPKKPQVSIAQLLVGVAQGHEPQKVPQKKQQILQKIKSQKGEAPDLAPKIEPAIEKPDLPKVSQQQLEKIVRDQLKKQNEVEEYEVIPTLQQQDSKSAQNSENRSQDEKTG